MKKQFFRSTRLFVGNRFTLITLAMLVTAQAATAQSRTVAVVEAAPVAMTASATVKHVGNPPGSVVFQVLYDNPTGEKFTVVIKDIDGATLYQDSYTDRKFDKKFQLPEGQSDKLKFIIRGVRTNQAQSFEVNTNTRVIEEIVVKRVG